MISELSEALFPLVKHSGEYEPIKVLVVDVTSIAKDINIVSQNVSCYLKDFLTAV